MPSVRAYMVLAALADHGEIVASEPAESDVDQFDGRTIEVWLATDARVRASSRRAARRACRDVASATVEEPRRAPERAAAAAPPPSRQARRGATSSPATSTVRVDSERLDQLMHLMGELVVHRTHAESLVAQAGVPGPPAGDAGPRAHLAGARRRWSCRCG